MTRERIIQSKKFSDINIDDPFFDSLKKAYAEFVDWFEKKAHKA